MDSSSSPSTSSPEHNKASWTAPAKRPAGRTKFRETRHPLYRGTRFSPCRPRSLTSPTSVADFQRREAASAPLSPDAEEPACSDSSSSAPSSSDNTVSSDSEFEMPVTMDSDMFRLDDLFPEMDFCTYYTSLAEALLMDPPPAPIGTGAYWDNVDCFDGGADVALWSY